MQAAWAVVDYDDYDYWLAANLWREPATILPTVAQENSAEAAAQDTFVIAQLDWLDGIVGQ